VHGDRGQALVEGAGDHLELDESGDTDMDAHRRQVRDRRKYSQIL